MENLSPCLSCSSKQPTSKSIEAAGCCSQAWVSLTKAAYISLIQQANYWRAQYAQLKKKCAILAQDNQYKDAKIKDLQNRLFGKKTEKQGAAKSEQASPPAKQRNRGQQTGSQGHGRTPRPDLPVISQIDDLAEEDKKCMDCGLPFLPKPALDESNDYIEVEVRAYTRRVYRPA